MPLAKKIGMTIGGAIGGVLGALIGIFIPSWLPQNKPQTLKANPADERLRSGAMFGTCVGIVLGAFVLPALIPLAIPLCILLGTGIGVALFSLAAYYLDDTYIHEEITDSNPWAKRIRAGIQWGACLGILVAILFPGFGIGLSVILSVAVGGALFSIAGALISLVVEPIITKLVTSVCGKDYATANPWGPRARCGSFYGTWIGTLIGCCIFPGFIGATLGGAIGGLVGGFVAVVGEPLYIKFMSYWKGENYLDTVEAEGLSPSSCLSGNSWSERCRTGAQIGAVLGACIGFFAFPPFGVFFGSAIGGILGGAVAFFIPDDWEKAEEKEDMKELLLDNFPDGQQANPIGGTLFPQSELTPSDSQHNPLSVQLSIQYKPTPTDAMQK